MPRPLSATDHNQQRSAVRVCTACGSSELLEFFATANVPVHVGILYETKEEAGRAALGDIVLCYCRDCGMVFNRLFDPSRLSFQPGYEVALHHSPVFRNYIEQLAQRLFSQYGLREKDIVEIGCGNGYFLELLCRSGNSRGTGIDPTVVKEGQWALGDTHDQDSAGQVRYLRDYFGPQHTKLPCDFTCCLSVFEDVPEPLVFLRHLHSLLSQRPDTACYFEVFNAFRAFQQRETWSVHYEQCNYFGQASLARLFRQSGFEVLAEGTCYEQDQYVYVESRPVPAEHQAAPATKPPEAEHIPAAISEFADEHQTKCELWRSRLERLRAENKRAVLWGSGGKGISFANALPTAGVIEQIVDINPDRQGKFIPGTGQKIVPPEFLIEDRPDYIILTNVMYEREIKSTVVDLGLDCEFWVA